MSRRRRVASDNGRLRLMWEAVGHLSTRAALLRLQCGETEGDRALFEVIERELTPAELAIVRRLVAGNEPARVLEALLPRLPHDEEPTFHFVEKAGVRWGRGGWVIRETKGVASLQQRRKRKVVPANPA